MDNKEIAKEVYKLAESDQDMGLKLLGLFKLIKNNDIDGIIKTYKEILTGEILIVEVYSRDELEASNKQAIENKLQAKYSEKVLVFDYDTNPKNKIGVMIKIGDNVLDGTF